MGITDNDLQIISINIKYIILRFMYIHGCILFEYISVYGISQGSTLGPSVLLFIFLL